MAERGVNIAKPTYRIENVVASVTLNQKLNLEKIAERVPNAEYSPEQFPGLVLRIPKPKTATLVFSSGKMVCTGAKSEKEVRKAVNAIISLLKSYDIDVKGEPIIEIQNIVASANLKALVDLEKAAYLLENSMYEPEQFPGLIFRMDEPKVVLLIFSSGKVVCTGARREEEVKDAIINLYNKLNELGALILE
ncbi:MAG: TATA-box-binding protein [Thermofilaceae archaeon]|nr:TATA-box-binding protein [Thermofilaceae archaeon]MDW8003656.1 TATA-box-binding protein [Thermofilaceae archaeon]